MATLSLISLLLLLGTPVLVVLYRIFFHKLSGIPGPKLAAATNLHQALQYVVGRWEESEYQIKLHKKYGPIVRYGPNTVIVNLPHELPTIYHRRADKSEWYSVRFGIPAVLTTLNHADHMLARRRIAQAYSMTAIKPFEEDIDERIKEWQTELESRFCAAGGTQALKFHEAINFLAYDIVTEIAFGESLGFVRKWSDHRRLINSYEGSIPRALGRTPLLSNIVRALGIYRPTDKIGLGVLIASVSSVFQLLLSFLFLMFPSFITQPPDFELTFGSRFLAWRGKDGSTMTAEEVKFESITAMVAGSRNIAEAISPFVLNVLRAPGCYQRLRRELEDGEIMGLLGSPTGVVPFETASSDRLPYFTACLQEGMRISATPVQMPRVSPPGGMQLAHDGKTTFIPAGAAVSSSSRLIALNEGLYGPDARDFRPERWLEASAETLKRWETYNLRWGYGTRTCIGKHLAVMEIYKICLQVSTTSTTNSTDGPGMPHEMHNPNQILLTMSTKGTDAPLLLAVLPAV
ncbi:Pisatin demethylase-like protein [Achaetomium macrosporum]|uniref:Pisatin demethylase-like protein n=1 Tax=Achaetomium macrosporum TaxID=79813 RepID=A0AAN7H921_9PEZI|nr:Pisatin demethylase-like protein [Achaetomium macrosporum]